MLGVSVHGLLGVDADLQRSAFAAREQHMVDYRAVRVVEHYGDCDQAPPPKSNPPATVAPPPKSAPPAAPPKKDPPPRKGKDKD